MATIKPTLDTRSKKTDGTYPLKLYLNHKGTSYINLGISVTEEQWNGREVVEHPKSKTYNKAIHIKWITAESIILNLSSAGKLNRMTTKQLKSCIENNSDEPDVEPEPKGYMVETHFRRYIDNTPNKRTKEIYRNTLDKIGKFAPKITFEEVNIAWLKSFDAHMATTCETNTRAIEMRNLRAVFNDAINEDLVSLSAYPFRKFKIRKEKTIKRSLSVEQLQLLKNYPVQAHQEKYRSIFFLMFYLIGINTIDLLRLKPDDLRNGRIDYIRAKTGRPYSIEVLPEAMKIIKKYRGQNYLIDILDNYANHKDFAARINENLKEIGKMEWVANTAKDPKFVKKNKKKITALFPYLTTYYARHSWATIAASLDIPKETISAALGHEIGSETTAIYIDFDLKKVDAANRQVIAHLNKK